MSSPRPSSLGRCLVKGFFVLASLQLAISLLSLFTLCLAAATFLESAYSTQVAQFLVYHTWWFGLLLGFLAVNVLCAALKKMEPARLRRWSWPWKKHQTGFLITHAGLLVLVAGGLLTTLGGTDGQMILIDTEHPEIQQWARMSNTGSRILLNDRQRIEVYHLPRESSPDNGRWRTILQAAEGRDDLADDAKAALQGHSWRFAFHPGPFAWHADEHLQPDLPWTIRLLQRLADPWPGFTRDLDGRATLTVRNYYPHTEYCPYSPAAGQAGGFPALQLRLTSSLMDRPLERWVTGMPALTRETSPISLEMMILHEPVLLKEFLNPPPARHLGPDGQLVVVLGKEHKTFRIPVDKRQLDRAVELPGTGLRLTLRRFGNLLRLVGREGALGDGEAPDHHAVVFTLSGPVGQGEYLACARFPNLPPLRKGAEVERIAVWYHHPDFRWGNASLMGAMQFLHAPDGRIYYRVFGKDGLRQAGQELDVADPDAIHRLPWQPMDMRFQVARYLPHAVARPSCIPRQVRPGAEPSVGLEPALRCTLTAAGRSEEFWLRQGRRATEVHVGGDTFFLRYCMDDRPVDFALTLKHAQQTTDPGTSRAGGYQSDVALTYTRDGKEVAEDHCISMNQPLIHGRHKVYQASYRPLTDPETLRLVLDPRGRLVSLSGLAVSHDPGLYLKYAGSSLLVLGIATMFFMRAYFFKRRDPPCVPKRTTPHPPSSAPDPR